MVVPSLTGFQSIIQAYQKILFVVPVLFVIAAFLALRISETGIVLISLSFLTLALSEPLIQLVNGGGFGLPFPEFWLDFFTILPFILPFSLSLIFLVPDRIGRLSMTIIMVGLSLFPLLFVFFPEDIKLLLIRNIQYDSFLFPWPAVAASFLPLAGPFIYRERRTGTFSAALTTSLILSLLPSMLILEDYLRETSFLLAGMILLHSLYRVYWDNSYIDELTGLFNRRALDERLKKLHGGYALAMVDVDHFKNFNDSYGHDEGDNVLRLVSKILFTHFGKYAFRYGGEEFCVIFKKINAESSAKEMDEARGAIEDHMFSIRTNIKNRKKSARKKGVNGIEKVRLTVSAGIAEPAKSNRDALSVLKNADKALYSAKEGGRNRVEIHRSRK